MTNKKSAIRDGFGQGLLKAGIKNSSIVVLSADLTESTRANFFKQKFPNRFIECGVAEQNMAGIAAGMALSGKIPFICSYAVFSPGRNWEQIRLSICYQNTNVKIISSHAGISTGPDGATHQGLEDIALTRCLPNMIVISPCDALQAEKATLVIAEHQGPVYLRLFKYKTPIITTNKTPFIIGKAQVLTKGKHITLIASGPVLNQAIQAAKELGKQKIDCEIINNHTIKPLDKKTITASVKKTKHLITIEDHQLMGGMGSAITEMLAQNYPVKTKMIGIQDRFGQSGTPKELQQEYGLTAGDIVKAVKQILKS